MIGQSSSKHKSLLGIEFEADRLRIVWAARNGHGVKIKKTLLVPITIDPLTGDADLFGKELRGYLQEAGITESYCLVCLPLPWILQQRIELPDLSGEDRANYIHLQAEREFPFPSHELSIATSPSLMVEDHPSSVMAAVPLTTIHAIEAGLKAARLKVLGVTAGHALPLDEDTPGHAIVLHKRERNVDCYVYYENTLFTFRSFEDQWLDMDDPTSYDFDSLLRELLLTLRALPPTLQSHIHILYTGGSGEWSDSIRPLLQGAFPHLSIQAVPPHELCSDSASLPLYGSLVRSLHHEPLDLELLPPRVSQLQKLMTRMSSRFNVLAGGSAAAVLSIAMLAFFYQHWTLSNYRAKWETIRDEVEELESIQKNIKTFQPWFRTSMPSLHALQTLTAAFPEEGSVWAQRIEIENMSLIECSGFARDNAKLLRMFQQLNEDQQVSLLNGPQSQGTDPLQFSFTYHWSEG